MKKYDVVALGELLIDFINNGVSEQGNNTFEACPGGAICNVLDMLAKLGKNCAFIGKVGDDIFGRRLKADIEQLSINTENLKMDKGVRTTLAFVENDETGDRSFSFYRNPGADIMLTADEIHGVAARQGAPAEEKVRKLVSLANDAGGDDNITVVNCILRIF